MLKLILLVASSLLVLSTANVLVKRQASTTSLSLCTDSEAAVVPGSVLEVKTPNFDHSNYNNNVHCKLRLQAGSQAVHLKVQVNTLDLENQVNCIFDDLCLYGTLFCGSWASGRTYEFIVPAGNSFTLGFKTDGSATGRGAYLTITGTAYSGEAVTIVSSGTGSSDSSLNFLTHNLSSLNYTDKCASIGYYTTYNPGYYPTTSYYPYTSVYDYSTTYNSYSTGYYDTTPYNPGYYPTTNYYPYTSVYDYFYSTTYNSYSNWYYDTTTYNPWYYPTTNYYQYTSDYYHSTTYNSYSNWYYDTTTYNTGYYPTTSYYQYSSGYYYATTYNPYITWYYDSTTYNPCQNGYYYTTGYCQYYTSSPSYNRNDYIVNELRSAMQEISSEQASQAQLYNRLANLLAYLANK